MRKNGEAEEKELGKLDKARAKMPTQFENSFGSLEPMRLASVS